MAAQNWYKSYHMKNIQLEPPAVANTFLMPNSGNEYPPNYGPYHMITSSVTPPTGKIYSGIEPLSSLGPRDLRRHFQNTSIPETARLIGSRSLSHNRPLVSSTVLLRDMDAAVEFYS